MPNLIPTWVYWAAIGVLTAASGAQQVRIANRDATLAVEVAARATETSARSIMAQKHADQVAQLQSQHAVSQQQKEDEYAQKLHKTEVANAAGRADAQRLRDRLATFTSGYRQPGETDATASQRAQYRLEIVGALLGEGVELEAESRAIIERRDAEVMRLLDQIAIDRVACSQP